MSDINKYIKHEKVQLLPYEYFVDISTPKNKNKFIKRIEKLVRSSNEYRDYIAFLKEECDLSRCAFLSNVDLRQNKHFKIEFHHEPFTLYDICSIVVSKFINSGERVNSLLIADEVMELHYENLVGLIPLNSSFHEIYHNSDKLIIPLNCVYGNYVELLNKYEDVMDEELYDQLLEKLKLKIEQTKSITPETYDAFTKQFTYYDVEGQEKVGKMPMETNKVV